MGLARPRGDRGPVARRLIVNADDLGRSAGVDRGIVRAHREGIVTSATLMANTTDAANAGAVARANPSLDVGVHLVLTFARPLSEPTRVRSLVTPTGEFLPAGHIDLAPLLGIIHRLGDGVTELMCHPAEPDAELLSGSTYARERGDELATLTDPRVRRALADRQVALTTFAAL